MRRATISGGILLGLLLAGCATKREQPAATHAAAKAEPVPPAGAAPGLPIPEPGSDGRFATINSGLNRMEAIWHLRAALNVAALSCPGKPGITQAYNTFLKDRKALLGNAYAAEKARYAPTATALDTHMTRLYNFFAQPPAQSAFCAAAASEAKRLASVSSAAFPEYARPALDRLEHPILAYYTAYNHYRSELAAYRAGSAKQASRTLSAANAAATMASAPASLARSPSSSNWRIQIGAFTGQEAAKAAWARARIAAPRLAAYTPVYEEVPARRELVRLQVGSADDRESALKLCAIAASGGFDCLPVAHP